MIRYICAMLLIVSTWAIRAEEPLPDQPAAAASGEISIDRALAIIYGYSYDESPNIDALLPTYMSFFDNEDAWLHGIPDQLKIKLEYSVGARLRVEPRLIASASMLGMWFPDCLANATFQPYLEGGVGVIYTDFQVSGQGTRWNFCPQIGVGTMIRPNDGPPWFVAARLHHSSNAGLHEDNAGLNFIMLMVGRAF